MRRIFAFIAVLSAGCGLDKPTHSNDPAEIARAARAAKAANAPPTKPSVPKGSKVEFLYFTAAWCPPCRKVKPLFHACKTEFPEVQFRELDVDDEANGELAAKNNVSAIPYFFVVVDGKTVASNRGAFSTKEKMAEFVRKNAYKPAD